MFKVTISIKTDDNNNLDNIFILFKCNNINFDTANVELSITVLSWKNYFNHWML